MDIAPCRTFIFINHPFQDAEISGQVAFAESRALELDAELKTTPGTGDSDDMAEPLGAYGCYTVFDTVKKSTTNSG